MIDQSPISETNKLFNVFYLFIINMLLLLKAKLQILLLQYVLLKEFEINLHLGYPTYKSMLFDNNAILKNHSSFMVSMNITKTTVHSQLICMFYKTVLLIRLTTSMSARKEGLQKYCETSRTGINHVCVDSNKNP